MRTEQDREAIEIGRSVLAHNSAIDRINTPLNRQIRSRVKLYFVSTLKFQTSSTVSKTRKFISYRKRFDQFQQLREIFHRRSCNRRESSHATTDGNDAPHRITNTLATLQGLAIAQRNDEALRNRVTFIVPPPNRNRIRKVGPTTSQQNDQCCGFAA